MAINNVFIGKTVLITGHTGFKGVWLSIWLQSLGARIVGVSLDVPTNPSHFQASKLSDSISDYKVDIRDRDRLKNIIDFEKPDFVFHLAAQALVRNSYKDPLCTISTNAVGSVNLLDALKDCKRPIVVVMITSDKAYDNIEWVWGYRESDRLGGKDPYSASKAMAEIGIRAYLESFFQIPNSNVRIGIARAGNVIGGGDWAGDRIVPDCIRAWSRDLEVDVRSPLSTRPWQHVLEPLSGYLVLANALYDSDRHHGEAYNFGPPASQNHTVQELICEMAKHWKNVRWRDISTAKEKYHEANLLKLNCDKALAELKWLPALSFEQTVRMTAQWYKAYYQNCDDSILDVSIHQIQEYTSIAAQRKIPWTIT